MSAALVPLPAYLQECLSKASVYFFISLQQTELYLLFFLFKAQQTPADLRSVNFPEFPEAGCLIVPSSCSAKH